MGTNEKLFSVLNECQNVIAWVLAVQADGSALYSLQALWTQAREQLHVITIICANRAYAILQVRRPMQADSSHFEALI